jgi:ferritin-like metal-binding protein YciE
MKKTARFEDLFQEGLADLYDAEKQIVAALPKMIAASSSEALSGDLAAHLGETKTHVSRLETIFEKIAADPGGGACHSMEALLGECERVIDELEKSPVLDLALIAAARKVEHYEIAGYSMATRLAEILGQQDVFDRLEETLEEEIEADEALEELAETILDGDTVTVEDDEEEKDFDEEEEEEEIENED